MVREYLPAKRPHEVVEFHHRGHRYLGGIGRYGDGRVAEIFLDAGKAGTALQSVSRDAAVLASIALQYGAPLDVIRHALAADEDGAAAGPIGALIDRIDDPEAGVDLAAEMVPETDGEPGL